MDSKVYAKRRTQNTSHGFDYQMDWSMLYILRAHDLHCKDMIRDYMIACENADAGDFDDITLTLVDNKNQTKHIFMQLKHKSGRKNMFGNDDLKEKKGDFSISKYFKSYQDIKRSHKYKIEDVHLVLHTNIDMHEDAYISFGEQIEELNEILSPPVLQAKYYRLKDEFIQNYLDLDGSMDETKDFAKRFLIAINQQDGKNLKSLILDQFYGLESEFLDNMLCDVKNWINIKDGSYISPSIFESYKRKGVEKVAKDFQLKTDIEADISEFFLLEMQEFLSSTGTKIKNVFYSNLNKHHILKAIEKCLNEKNKCLIYVSDFEDLDSRKDIFWLAKGEALVVDCGTTIKYNEKKRFCEQCWKIFILLKDYELDNRNLVHTVPHIKECSENLINIGVYSDKDGFEKCDKKLSMLLKKNIKSFLIP